MIKITFARRMISNHPVNIRDLREEREKVKRLLPIILCVALSACETSLAWYATQPHKEVRISDIDFKVYVLPDRVDVQPGSAFSYVTDAIAYREAQIKAVTEVTGCRVVSSANINVYLLQAKVDCKAVVSDGG